MTVKSARSDPRQKIASVRMLDVEIETGGKRRKIGRLAIKDRRIFFEYASEFLAQGLEISPFSLPLAPGVHEGVKEPFAGLHGLFNDSLPDAWGRLLIDRRLASFGIVPGSLTPLDRLAWVGRRGMGALIYRPETGEPGSNGSIDLDRLADEARQVLEGDAREIFEVLFQLGGSPGGARPKVLVGTDAGRSRVIHGAERLPDGYEPWMVKFGAHVDTEDSGAVEFAYARMAAAAGIEMEPVHLFPSKTGSGYFGTRRFDRGVAQERIHIHTLCGLVHADHTLPSIDYGTFLRVAHRLTGDQREVEKMFRLMVFNIAVHNRDDHTKNFAFRMAPNGTWTCAPAYDITFSAGPGGEHSMAIAGEGIAPGSEHVTRVADEAGIRRPIRERIAEEVFEVVSRWPSYADEAGVMTSTKNEISAILAADRRNFS